MVLWEENTYDYQKNNLIQLNSVIRKHSWRPGGVLDLCKVVCKVRYSGCASNIGYVVFLSVDTIQI